MTTTTTPDARILIAEDDDSNVLLLEMLLQNAGYRNLRTTSDPRSIVEDLDAFPPDLLLLDLHMPHMSGFDVLRLVREHHEDHFPVIILSGDTDPNTRSTAGKLGATDFLVKPFDINAVLRCVGHHLELRFQARSEKP